MISDQPQHRLCSQQGPVESGVFVTTGEQTGFCTFDALSV